MEIEIPNEVALSPSGGDLWFDTDARKFFEPIGFCGCRRWIRSMDMAKLKRLSPAVEYVKANWTETKEGSE